MLSASEFPVDALIRKLDTIAKLSDTEREALQSLPITIRLMRPGQDIVTEGERPTQCVLISSGWACRYKLLPEGRRQLLSLHVPGDIPDLQSLHLSVMDHNLCSASEAVVAYIPHQSLRVLTATHPNIAAAFWRDTLIDAAVFREWIIGLGRRSAYQRTAHLFCELYTRLHEVGLATNFSYSLPLTQADLADALGLSNVHINRTIQELRKSKLISFRSRTLTINNWEGLSQASEFDPNYLHQRQRQAA